VGVTSATVGKWRERYRVQGMKGLSDDSRPGTPRRITDAKVEEAVTQTLESLPPAATHWSTRSLAQKVGLSQSAVGSDLAQFWVTTASKRNIQAVHRSLAGGESA
jgi:transposase